MSSSGHRDLREEMEVRSLHSPWEESAGGRLRDCPPWRNRPPSSRNDRDAADECEVRKSGFHSTDFYPGAADHDLECEDSAVPNGLLPHHLRQEHDGLTARVRVCCGHALKDHNGLRPPKRVIIGRHRTALRAASQTVRGGRLPDIRSRGLCSAERLQASVG